jgi:uncharacterized membrane protein YccC
MLICPLFVLSVLTALFALFVLSVLTALFALAWRFEPTMVVVLFGVLRFVLAMVGVVARVNHPFFQPSKSTKKMGRYPFIVKI